MRDPRRTEEGEWLWRAAKLLLLAIAMVAAALLAWWLADVLLLLFAAVLLAVLLRALAQPIERFTPLPERWSVILAVLVLVAVLAGFIWLLGTEIRRETTLLLENLPNLVDSAENWLGIEGLGDWLDRQRLDVAQSGGRLVLNVASYATQVVSIGALTLTVMFAGIYFALTPRSYLEGVLKLLPEGRQPRARDTLETLGSALKLWLLGQLVAMVVIGVVTGFGLWLLGIRSALTLGLIAGILEFVPVVGPVLSAVPSVVVGLADGGLSMGLWVVALYVVIQQGESILLTPLIAQRSVDLPPVVTIFAIIVFAALFGPLGVFLATPLAVVCMVVVKKLWVRETLQEEVSVPGEDEGKGKAAG